MRGEWVERYQGKQSWSFFKIFQRYAGETRESNNKMVVKVASIFYQ